MCTALLMGCNKPSSEERKINVIFRYDDYSALSPMDMELRIINIFRKNKASITFGVIPFVIAGNQRDPAPQDFVPLTSIKGDLLKAAFKEGILDIALHGYSHQTIDAKRKSEFSGLDYSSQLEKLTKGKIFLEKMINAPVITFVPPWNNYDLNTVRALEELGFSTLSARRKVKAPKDSTLNFLPTTCSLSKLRDAVKAARRSPDVQPVIVALFHAFDFLEVDEKRGNTTYQEFSDLLHWLRLQEDVRLLSISQATKVINDLSVDRFHLNNKVPEYFLPAFLLNGYENVYIDPSKMLSKFWLYVVVFYLTIATLAAFVSFMAGYWIFPKSQLITNIGTYAITGISVSILIYAFHDFQISVKGMILSAIVVGASAGVWYCLQYLKNKRL